MEKLIIENRTEKPMAEILPYVNNVVKQGKISGTNRKQYCYYTAFKDVGIWARLNAKSDRLVVVDV